MRYHSPNDAAQPCDGGGDGLPQDDKVVGDVMKGGGVDGSPHAAISGERRVHLQDVADELEVRVVVGEVVEDDERTEEGNAEDEDALRETDSHRSP
jgi:hypothetical protein